MNKPDRSHFKKRTKIEEGAKRPFSMPFSEHLLCAHRWALGTCNASDLMDQIIA